MELTFELLPESREEKAGFVRLTFTAEDESYTVLRYVTVHATHGESTGPWSTPSPCCKNGYVFPYEQETRFRKVLTVRCASCDFLWARDTKVRIFIDTMTFENFWDFTGRKSSPAFAQEAETLFAQWLQAPATHKTLAQAWA